MDERRIPPKPPETVPNPEAAPSSQDNDSPTETEVHTDGSKTVGELGSGNRQKTLTHRPRAHGKISPEALAASLSRREDAPLAKLIPGLPSPDQRPKTDLRPFADQLVAIAEQLRSGSFLGSEPVSGTPSAGDKKVTASQSARIRSIDKGQPVEASLASMSLAQRRRAFAEMARTTYAKRRKRSAIFGDPELFGEPGWDILLDLYIAHAEGKPVSVSSACIGSASPPTTGLRWLGVLSEQDLVAREHDTEDQRRVLVRLTDKALEAMGEYFSSSASTQGDLRAAGA